MHASDHLRPFPVLHVGRTFRDKDDVSVMESFRQIAEPSEREKFILINRSVVVDQDYVEVCLEGPVLEGVIEDYKVGRGKVVVLAPFGPLVLYLEFFRMSEKVAALDSRSVYRNRNLRIFLLDLDRFVSVERGASVNRDLLEAETLAFVAPRKNGNIFVGPVLAGEESLQNHLCVRGFAGPACRNVAYADCRDITLIRFPHAAVVKGVANF